MAACTLTCCLFYSFSLETFTTPFISYNSSLSGVLVSILLLLLFPQFKQRVLTILWFIISFILLARLESRTGIVMWAAGCGLLYLLNNKQASLYWKRLIQLFCIVSCLSIILALFLKPDSTQGRWFIWRNCFALIKQHFWTGAGLGQFRVAYNNQQASWFKQNGFQNSETMLADTVNFAFNEWLQMAVEIGVPITIFIFTTLIFLMAKTFRIIQNGNTTFYDRKVIAAFAAILVSTFFSYPFFYLPTLFLFAFLLVSLIIMLNFQVLKKYSFFVQVSQVLILAGIIIILSFQYHYRLQWKEGVALQELGNKKEALIKMNKAYPLLKTNADFLYSLAGIFESLGKTDSAIILYEKSSSAKNDYELHRKIGKLYMEKGDYQLAEFHFLQAVYMVPNRFVSRELLVNYYTHIGNAIEAKRCAKETIQLKQKTPSATTRQIKERLQFLLD